VFSRYWAVSIFLCLVWPLTFDLIDLKINNTSVQSLMSFKQEVPKTLNGHYILCPVWPLTFGPKNLYWSSTLHGVPVYKVWSLLNKGLSRYWVVSIFICPIWPLTSKSIGLFNLLFRIYQDMKFECLTSSKGFSRYWAISIFLSPVDPWPLDLKPILVIYSSWCTSVQSLKSVKQRVLKILSGQYIPVSSLTIDRWSQNQ
jgi:hypothetical protein